MDTPKLILEIYQGDPFAGACCGPGTRSPESIEKLRKMLTERSQILKKLQEEFRDKMHLKSEIVSPKRWDYPEHVRRLMAENLPLPYIFMNEKAVVTGKFPSYADFAAIIEQSGFFSKKP